MLRVLEHICGRLSERRASLFLGAGINVGIHALDGTAFPLIEDLAKMICRDLLGDEKLVLTLDEAAEYSRHRIGAPEFNKYLFDLFSKFQPGRCHLLLVKLPWDTIYTNQLRPSSGKRLCHQSGASRAAADDYVNRDRPDCVLRG